MAQQVVIMRYEDLLRLVDNLSSYDLLIEVKIALSPDNYSEV